VERVKKVEGGGDDRNIAIRPGGTKPDHLEASLLPSSLWEKSLRRIRDATNELRLQPGHDKEEGRLYQVPYKRGLGEILSFSNTWNSSKISKKGEKNSDA